MNDYSFLQPKEIIDKISAEINLNKGIIPLIGAGMSAASGIPAGKDYKAYLFYCLAKVFGSNGMEKNDIQQWDPQTMRWPDLNNVPLYSDLNNNMNAWVNSIKIESCNNSSLTLQREIKEAIKDWSSILTLLARLTLGKTHNNNYCQTRKIVLRKGINERVTDSFFINLTKNKNPNSAHMLMAHLSDILRVKIILTTNFDNLIEDSYRILRKRTAVYDVHLDAKLPAVDFVRAQRSVVKMHGSRYGLRADSSLDKKPSKKDANTFINYLRYYKNKEPFDNKQCQRDLLVIGISPESKRVISLISSALNSLTDMNLYWICYTESEKKEVHEKFKESLNEFLKIDNSKVNEIISQKIHITSITDLTPFLLQLYQTVFLSVPPAGVQFNSVWLYPQKPQIKKEKKYKTNKSLLLKQLQTDNTLNKKKNFIYIYGKTGASALAADVFYECQDKYPSFWINIEEYYSNLDFVFTLIEALSKRIGVRDLVPANHSEDDLQNDNLSNEIINQYKRLLYLYKKEIKIYVNCRNNPCKKLIYATQEIADLISEKLIYNNVSFILIGWNEINNIENFSKIQIDEHIVKPFEIDSLKRNIEEFKKINSDFNEKNFWRFVFALTLIRQTAYISMIHSWAFIKAPQALSITKNGFDNDKERFEMAKQYLSILKKSTAIRNDEEIFIFMPAIIRTKVKKEYMVLNNDYRTILCECHQGIADWYMKLYRSSEDIHALKESIYHRISCFKEACKIKNSKNFITTSLIEVELAIKLCTKHAFPSLHVFRIRKHLDALYKRLEILSQIKVHQDYKFELSEIQKQLSLLQKQYPNQYIITPKTIDEHGILVSSSNTERIQEKQQNCLEKYNKELNLIIIDIHLRNYGKAEKKIKKLYIDLGYMKINALLEDKTLSTESIRINIRELNYKLLNIDTKSQCLSPSKIKILKILIELLRYHHRLLLLQSQLERYIGNNYYGFLVKAEKIYICSTDSMRFINDNEFLNRENAYLRTNTGIMLSWMNRHNEAYRRYNEAYGYLSFGNTADLPLQFAIVDLRRSETFISKMEQSTENSNKKESIRYMGFLYDAIESIDRAEYRMSNYSINPWWRSWMIELQMSLCIKIAYFRNSLKKIEKQDKYDLFSHCRQCDLCGSRFLKNLIIGLEIATGDIIRVSRYLELTQQFIKSGLSSEHKRTLNIKIKDIKSLINQSLLESDYESNIINFTTKILQL